MKKALWIAIAVVFVVGFAACTSSSGEVPDTDTVADAAGEPDIGPGLPPDTGGMTEGLVDEEGLPRPEDISPEAADLPDVPEVTDLEDGRSEEDLAPELAEDIGPAEIVEDPAVVSTFDDLELAAESFWNGADETGGFTSGDAWFLNLYNTEYMSWDGFSYSNVTDTTTPGYDNQFGVIAGAGCDGSANFAVGHDGTGYGAEPPTISLLADAPGEILDGMYVTNTTYAYLSMLEGDDFAKKFGGDNGEDPDWYLLTITGIDEDGNTTGPIGFYLADFRAADSNDDYIVSDWTWVDLKLLGQVIGLQLTVTSSDVGDWGMNTPAFFAIDGLRRVVP